MTSSQAKIGWKTLTKRKNKNCLSVPFQPDGTYKIPEKEKKNQKNQKIPLWLHFKPKRGWKRPRNRENKNFRSVLFSPNA